MDIFTHTYRVIKSSWGIWIKISGEYLPMSDYSNKSSCTEICNGLWATYTKQPISLEDIPAEIDKNHIYSGLGRVSNQILSASPLGKDTLVAIHSIEIAHCDFQEEGLTPAVIEWVSKLFDFEPPSIHIAFNKQDNKYEFTY